MDDIPKLAGLLKSGMDLESEVTKLPDLWDSGKTIYSVKIKIRYEGVLITQTEFTIGDE